MLCQSHLIGSPKKHPQLAAELNVFAFSLLIPGQHGQLLGAVVVVVAGEAVIFPLLALTSLHPLSGNSNSSLAGSPPLVGVSLRHGCHCSRGRTPPSDSKAEWRGTLCRAIRKFSQSSFACFRKFSQKLLGQRRTTILLCHPRFERRAFSSVLMTEAQTEAEVVGVH